MEKEGLTQALSQWIEQTQRRPIAGWEQLPDLGLYMDQVITYLERYNDGSGDKPMTPSMINNYVKAQIIPRPDGKKYNREHLASLMILSGIKQIVPLATLSALFGEDEKKWWEQSEEGAPPLREWYTRFCDTQREAMRQVMAHLSAELTAQSAAEGEETPADSALRLTALELIVEANARRIAAQKILELLSERKQELDGEEHGGGGRAEKKG